MKGVELSTSCILQSCLGWAETSGPAVTEFVIRVKESATLKTSAVQPWLCQPISPFLPFLLPAVSACGESAQAVTLLWCLLLGFSVDNGGGYLGSRLLLVQRCIFYCGFLKDQILKTLDWAGEAAASFVIFLQTHQKDTALASGYLPRFLLWAFLGCTPMSRPYHTWHRRPMRPYWILSTTWWTKPAELLHLRLGRNSLHPLALSGKSMASGVCMPGF